MSTRNKKSNGKGKGKGTMTIERQEAVSSQPEAAAVSSQPEINPEEIIAKYEENKKKEEEEKKKEEEERNKEIEKNNPPAEEEEFATVLTWKEINTELKPGLYSLPSGVYRFTSSPILISTTAGKNIYTVKIAIGDIIRILTIEYNRTKNEASTRTSQPENTLNILKSDRMNSIQKRRINNFRQSIKILVEELQNGLIDKDTARKDWSHLVSMYWGRKNSGYPIGEEKPEKPF